MENTSQSGTLESLPRRMSSITRPSRSATNTWCEASLYLRSWSCVVCYAPRYALSSPGLFCQGRILAFRIAGSKLAFIDIFQNNRLNQLTSHKLQCVLNFDKISWSNFSSSSFAPFLQSLRRGDICSKWAMSSSLA